MKQLAVKPEIHKFETAKEFAEAFKLGKDDLVKFLIEYRDSLQETIDALKKSLQ